MNRTKSQGSARGRRRRNERALRSAQEAAQKRRYHLQKSETEPKPFITYRLSTYRLRDYNPFYTLTTRCKHGFQAHELGGPNYSAVIAKAVQAHKAALSCNCNGAPQAYSPTHQ